MKMFVGNLPYNCTEEQLEELFGQFGKVTSAKIVTDRETGRSRGFGFVEMEDETEAKNAMEALDGNEELGRRIAVNKANERPARR